MRPDEVLNAIIRGLKDASEFQGGDYIAHEMDAEGSDNRLEQPIVTLNVESNPRATEWDSDLVGYWEDDQGQRQGRIFRPSWDMTVDAFVIVAAGNDSLDASALGGKFQNALLNYDSQVLRGDFPDGSGGIVEEIESFTVGDGERQDNLGGPGLRQWRQTLSVTFYHEIRTDDTVIDTVIVPMPEDTDNNDDFTVSSGDENEPAVIWNYNG